MIIRPCRVRLSRLVPAVALLAAVGSTWLAPGAASAQSEPRGAGDEAAVASVQAPTRLHSEPNVYGLVTLPGDFVTVRYSAGHLDRAARLQARLEPALRVIRDWAGVDDLEVTTYLLSREDWERARIAMPYGVPVRVGRTALAAPALGDDGTVGLWADLGIGLPSAQETPLRGTPQQAQSMVLADVLALLQQSEIVVDRAILAGDSFWSRALVTHIALESYLTRYQPDTARDLDLVWRQIDGLRPLDTFSTADYRSEMGLLDWLWFQARYQEGARLVVADEGRGAVRRVRKIAKRNGGGLTGALLFDEYAVLEPWFDRTFSAVSMRR
ncbi:MAG: hypothetical protein AAGC60_13985 [Acidobacteriota bacterium]